MFRSHILKKNIRNLYTIDTDQHTSNSITTTTLNGFTFPTEDGSSGQVLSTNGSNELSFISTISGELINDTTPQLAGNLDLNSFNITGTGAWSGNNLNKSQIIDLVSDLSIITGNVTTNTNSISTTNGNVTTNANNIALKSNLNNPSFTGEIKLKQSSQMNATADNFYDGLTFEI